MKKRPTREDCQIGMEDVDLGFGIVAANYEYYTCVQTSEGRLGWIRYDQDFLTTLPNYEIQYTYFLWEEIDVE